MVGGSVKKFIVSSSVKDPGGTFNSDATRRKRRCDLGRGAPKGVLARKVKFMFNVIVVIQRFCGSVDNPRVLRRASWINFINKHIRIILRWFPSHAHLFERLYFLAG